MNQATSDSTAIGSESAASRKQHQILVVPFTLGNAIPLRLRIQEEGVPTESQTAQRLYKGLEN